MKKLVLGLLTTASLLVATTSAFAMTAKTVKVIHHGDITMAVSNMSAGAVAVTYTQGTLVGSPSSVGAQTSIQPQMNFDESGKLAFAIQNSPSDPSTCNYSFSKGPVDKQGNYQVTASVQSSSKNADCNLNESTQGFSTQLGFGS